MKKPLRVLVVEDSEDDTSLIVRELERGGYDPTFKRVETSEAMAAALERETWDVILSDYIVPHFSGLGALKLLQETGLDLPFIIVSGSVGEDSAAQAMKTGAHDYLMKGHLARLVPAIERELRQAEARRKLRESEKALSESEKRYREVVEEAVYRDIRERKQKELEKAALEQQFRQSQKMEAVGRLAGGLAHDFNNLLTIIKGYSQLLSLEIKEDDPLRGNVEQIMKATDRASDLIRQLLAFSRRQILEMKVLDLNAVLRDVEKMLRRVIGEDVELATFLAEDLGKVRTDQGQIEQVVMNLAVNAKDAMPGGGKLIIETANVDLDEDYARIHVGAPPGRYVMLSVSDTGKGMAPEMMDQIFEPFFTTKETGRRTGLGLSTVYGIVKQSDGHIAVYSEPGRGTTFKIFLPQVDGTFEETQKGISSEKLPRGTETILVVEDEEAVRHLAASILKNQGYEVLEARDGEAAVRICESHNAPVSLLLTDVVMPKVDGRVLYGRLLPVHRKMKVLYMSGHTENAIVRDGVLEEGINYIQKPFSVEGLTRRVRDVLDG